MQLDFDLKGGPPPKAKEINKPLEPVILSVGALTRKVRGLLESGIGDIWVEGEISNLRRQSSGHVYFTLKDESSQLACVLFAGQTAQLRGMKFADGVQVQLFGQVTVYEARGSYQMIVRRVQECGVGALQAKFEELKRRLDAEGLFRPERKRVLPKFPNRIGVVTSPTGAAIQDFLNVLHRRQPGISVVIYPVRVQGKGAAAEIASAVRAFGDPSTMSIEPVDVIVVTRGGGSLEDLWEFNEEAVARAIAESPVPVVSAVGHEIDFTIADFAADLRAPTPSAAAEILSADSADLLARLDHLAARLRRPVENKVDALRSFLNSVARTALFQEPARVLREQQQNLDRLAEDMQSSILSQLQNSRFQLERHSRTIASHSPERRMTEMLHCLTLRNEAMERLCRNRLKDHLSRLEKSQAVLEALNPSAALARGYTLTLDESGHVIRSASSTSQGQNLTTRFHDGAVRSRVESAENPPPCQPA
ncbi:MAG: exodeoxyribonuclease VII large subunit [Verrucomicrobia bacterium]|nr:exodeoxyribonuclease VII large subunit [Verrucomicrobiota bacterium]